MITPDLVVLADAEPAERLATTRLAAASAPDRAILAAKPAVRAVREGKMEESEVVMATSVDLD
jgi:hypothetical protein